MKALSKIFLKGLAGVLPIAITAYLLYWLGASAESALGGLIKLVLPEALYWPGMGLVAGVLLVLLLGVLMNAWLVRSVLGAGERVLHRIPLVKTVYGAVRDLTGFFASAEERPFGQVVMVSVAGFRLLGLVTREDFSRLPDGIGDETTVAVYLPMSYQVGGYTVMLPRSAIEPVDMPLQDAVRYAVTAGMSVKSGAPPPRAART